MEEGEEEAAAAASALVEVRNNIGLPEELSQKCRLLDLNVTSFDDFTPLAFMTNYSTLRKYFVSLTSL